MIFHVDLGASYKERPGLREDMQPLKINVAAMT
jgi:hypothetical protein